MTSWKRAAFLDCVLTRADFYSARPAGARLQRCDLRGTELSAADLRGALLHGSTLDGLRGGEAFRGVVIGSDQVIPLALSVFPASASESTTTPVWRTETATKRRNQWRSLRVRRLPSGGMDVARVFDDFGDREWDRLTVDVAARVSFEIHRRFLMKHLRTAERVLEVGAGAGRFTIELVRMGCTVTVTDISAGQLERNAVHVAEHGVEYGVEDRLVVDARDLSLFPPASFDAVVAYGGVLSYTFDDAPGALANWLKVVRSPGRVVGSVMSLAGNARHYLGAFPGVVERCGPEAVERLLHDGDQRAVGATGVEAFCHHTRSSLERTIAAAGGEGLDWSASNWLSLGDPDALRWFEAEPTRWARFLDWEANLCRQPGIVDGGTHLLFATAAATDQRRAGLKPGG